MKDYIHTYTGKKFRPTNPDPDDICIEDIAHALSMICRFTGHCPKFYSVAQHSWLVSQLAAPDFPITGLLHDASEAYLADIALPVKNTDLLIGYREAERRLDLAIAKRFGLTVPLRAIKPADHAALLIEVKNLFSFDAVDEWGCAGWPLMVDRKHEDKFIVPWIQKEAEYMFLQEAEKHGIR